MSSADGPSGVLGALRTSGARVVSSARMGMALRAALAAALAWGAAQAAPAPADAYPYYAPLGAVIATSFTVVGSLRESIQAVAAIGVGSAIGLLAQQVAAPGVVTIAAVVMVGVLVAGWQRLGTPASWVPTSALFVLVLGAQDPSGFAGSFAGLTLLGAVIGVLVNVAVGPLPLGPIDRVHERVRRALSHQLDLLADGLGEDELPDPHRWSYLSRELAPYVADLRADARHHEEARRINLRARRWHGRADRARAESRRLADLTWHVETLRHHLVGHEHAELEHVSLGPALRPPAITAIRALGAHLKGSSGTGREPVPTPDLREVDAALHTLRDEIRERPGDTFHAAAVVAMLEEIRAGLAAGGPVGLPDAGGRRARP